MRRKNKNKGKVRERKEWEREFSLGNCPCSQWGKKSLKSQDAGVSSSSLMYTHICIGPKNTSYNFVVAHKKILYILPKPQNREPVIQVRLCIYMY